MGNDESKKSLQINCGLACLLRDREGVLDKYDTVQINSGAIIVSSELNARLAAKGAALNGGSVQVQDIRGEILQLDEGAVIDGAADYRDLFIMGIGDLIIRGRGAESLRKAEGLIVAGTLYYPDDSDRACLAKARGELHSYPAGAWPLLGSYEVGQALAAVPPGTKQIWVSKTLKALDEKALAGAKAGGVSFGARDLLIYEGLNEGYGALFSAPGRTLVPDGYEVLDTLRGAELPLHGPRIFVQSGFSMDEKDLPLLNELESIIVKGKADLPVGAAKAFHQIGRAGEYHLFEGRPYVINGFEQFSHDQLQALVGRGEKLSVLVNGCLLFADDVSLEDMDCIATLSYNGMVLVPPTAAKAALSSRLGQANGAMLDTATLQAVTGKSLPELIARYSAGGSIGEGSQINTGTYLLM
ncbi:MAG: hypothetical protein LBT16_03250 [Treponema sp.]|jgi:hypothetical protein|nr:hypothetical protein [Treponema sp.]